MRYRYDVEFTTYLTVEVEADSEAGAEALAMEKAEYSLKEAKDLSSNTKATLIDIL